MNKNMIEENMHENIRNFKYEVSENVWAKIENEIAKKKKKRVVLLLFTSLISLISLSTIGYYFQHDITAGSTKESFNIDSSQNHLFEFGSPNVKINHTIIRTSKDKILFDKDTAEITEKKINGNDEENIESFQNISYPVFETQANNEEKESTTVNLQNYEWSSKNKLIFPAPTFQKNMNGQTKSDIAIAIQKDTIVVDPYLKSAAKIDSIKNKKEHTVQLNTYLSSHGSGDLLGIFMELGKEKCISKRFSFYNNIGISLHSGQAYTGNGQSNVPLNTARTSMQFVTAGIQTAPTILFHSIGRDLNVGIGMVGRYQASSAQDMYSVSYYGSSSTVSPNVAQVTLNSTSKANTFSLGYRISVELMVKYSKRKNIGLQMFFQNDTRGDVIGGLGMSLKYK